MKPSSRLLHQVYLRREGRLMGRIPTRLLIPKIQDGTLKATDEFSAEQRHWQALGRHPQLAPYFRTRVPGVPQGLDRELGDLAALLEEINRG